MTSHAQTDRSVRPNIYLSESDHTLLSAMVGSAPGAQPGATLLREELDRAVIVKTDEMPSGFANLGSFVRYEDALTGRVRTVQLVLPVAADLEQNRVSVFTPIGAALLGIGRDQAFACVHANGQVRKLRVLEVLSRGEAGTGEAS
jgi:regulator of nucleoside diphosphate kinase